MENNKRAHKGKKHQGAENAGESSGTTEMKVIFDFDLPEGSVCNEELRLVQNFLGDLIKEFLNDNERIVKS